MGKGFTGSGLAAPVFRELCRAALQGKRSVDFRVPEGMTVIPIDRKTGMRARLRRPEVIMEAFKPGTGPADSYSVIGDGYILRGSPVGVQSRPTSTVPCRVAAAGCSNRFLPPLWNAEDFTSSGQSIWSAEI